MKRSNSIVACALVLLLAATSLASAQDHSPPPTAARLLNRSVLSMRFQSLAPAIGVTASALVLVGIAPAFGHHGGRSAAYVAGGVLAGLGSLEIFLALLSERPPSVRFAPMLSTRKLGMTMSGRF